MAGFFEQDLVARQAEDIVHGVALSTRSLGVNDAFRNAFAFEVRVLLEQVPVLGQKRSSQAGGQAVLVVSNGTPIGGGHNGAFGHRSVFQIKI